MTLNNSCFLKSNMSQLKILNHANVCKLSFISTINIINNGKIISELCLGLIVNKSNSIKIWLNVFFSKYLIIYYHL